MRVQFSRLKTMFREALLTSGADAKDIDAMLFLELEQDLHANLFSGLRNVEDDIRELQESRHITYSVEVDMPALKLLNGNGRNAPFATMLRDVFEMYWQQAHPPVVR